MLFRSRPDYVVNTISRGEGRKDRWREIGLAFQSEKSDTLTIFLDALPLDGKLVLTRPKERVTSAPAGEGTAES